MLRRAICTKAETVIYQKPMTYTLRCRTAGPICEIAPLIIVPLRWMRSPTS
jgi:hypothetical protein